MEADDLKKRVDLVALCQRLGLDPKGKVARCPAHSDTGRPNLHIYDDHVFCFACEWTGDAFDLVAKVEKTDFQGAKDFLAGFVGLPLIGDYRKKAPSTTRPTTPAKPLPDAPSPTLATRTPKPVVEYFDDYDQARARWVATPGAALRREGRGVGRYIVTIDPDDQVIEPTPATPEEQPVETRPSLRAKVFADLLAYTKPVVNGDQVAPAGAWLVVEKGISLATQTRFGLCWLDWEAADAGLRQLHDEETLRRFGLLTEAGKLHFEKHRFLFPFYWRGVAVDVQGRNFKATDKSHRFVNTGGKNPLPYNADDLVEARRTGKPVFLCEGATDTLALSQSGRLVVGIVGTGGFKADWLPYFDGLKVYLAFDGDQAGREAARKVSRVFVDAGHAKPKVIRLPEGVKDVNQFFRGAE